jgi:hypothetical protein
MKKLSILLLLASVIFSCNKPEKGTPKCVRDKIKTFDKSSTTCNDANVKEYKFQGGTVYAFDPGTCGADMTTEIINSDCNTLGHLGGITGNTKINGEEFSNAMFVKVTWKK